MAVSPILKRVLDQYGLGSLVKWANTAIINGSTEDEILLELYERPEFKTRFPALDTRRKAGYPTISVEEYLAYESFVHAQATMWGYPITKKEIDNLLGNNVSNVEVERRFDIASAAVFEEPQETRDELGRLFNVDHGKLMKYYMNPKEQLGVLEQQFRQAQVAGAAIRSGFGQITAQQAAVLTGAGLDRNAAVQGFGQLVEAKELFTPLDVGEVSITEDQQISFLAGDADVQELIKSRVQKRKAEFEGGGGFAVGEEGFATGTTR